VTLAIETLRVDHHAAGLSYVLAARLLPAVLFTLAGGVLVDRVPRRLVVLASDVARGAAVTIVTVLVATGGIHLVGLVCMALVFGIGDAVFFPAAMAIPPDWSPRIFSSVRVR
jgi:MFS family permease